jgi:limonene-1,2-epoxide hydrolase
LGYRGSDTRPGAARRDTRSVNYAAPIEIVAAFIAEWSKGHDALHASYRRYFTERTVWENVGLATTIGIDEAIAFMEEFERSTGFTAVKVDMLAIAAAGTKVLTERIDRFYTATAKELVALRLMGVFEIEGTHITAWRDYLDTAALGPLVVPCPPPLPAGSTM